MAVDDKTEIFSQSFQEFPCLEIVAGPHAGSRFPLQMGKNLLGRAADNDIVLEDSSVSRKHAVVERTPNTLSLTDAGSRNGTKVNGEKISAAVPLEHDARFKVGLYEFRLLMNDAPPAKPSMGVDGGGVKEPSSPKIEVASFSSRKPASGKAGRDEPQPPPVEEGPPSDIPDLNEGNFIEEEAPAKKVGAGRRRWFLLGLLVVLLAGVGYLGKGPVSRLFRSKIAKKAPLHKMRETDRGFPRDRAQKRAPVAPVEGESVPREDGEEAPNEEVGTPLPVPTTTPVVTERPVFLDFSSSPLPVQIFFGEQAVGTTPLRTNTNLKVGSSYEARGVFNLPDIGETLEEKVQFPFAEGDNVIPIHFSGKVGVFKVSALPRDTQLYLEGYFEKDPYRPKPIKFAEIVYGKPIYVPYGRFIMELRRSRQLGTSQTFLDEVVYHREFFVKEDQSNYTVEVRDEELNHFPIQITSQPSEARVYIDDKEVGATPYSGTFPVGEHVLTLKHEGYFDYSQLVKVALNTPYVTELQMKTTEAGELVNRAVELMKQERHAEALPLLVEAFSKKPSERETAQISYFVGLCYLKQKMLAEANSYFVKAGEHPDFVFFSKLGLASLSFEQGQADGALSLLVEVMIGATDPKVRSDAGLLFQKVSPLKSVVYVTSDPVGASVLVNGVDVKQVTPLILHDLGLGSYRVEVRKDGYQNAESKLNLGVSEFQPIVIKLPPVAKLLP